jgi:hypothetical protein
MSSRFKRCKTCGTTNSSDFAPRKSVICKACESGPSSSVTFPDPIITETKVLQPVIENTEHETFETTIQEKSQSEALTESSESKVNIKNTEPKSSEASESKNHEASDFISREEYILILNKFSEVETNYNLLKVEVEKLGRLKKMFPRMFPEDNPI